MNTKELITVDETLALLKGRVGKGTLRNWRSENSKVQGPEFRLVEGRVRYVRASVEKFAETYAFRKKAVVALALVCLLLLASCSSIKKAVVLPAKEFAAGERAMHELVATRFVDYVNADPALNDSQRAALVKAVNDWELAIAAAERAVEERQ